VTAPLFDFEARVVNLLGRVGPAEINTVIDNLLRLDTDSAKKITVYISCQGGDIVEALKLVDTVGLLRLSA
jgi:ATP-dependent protease ClpP protease subunit